MKRYRTYEFTRFIVTVIVIACAMLVSFFLAYRIGKMEEQQCINLFQESAYQISCSMGQEMEYACDSLKILGNLIKDSDSLKSEKVRDIMAGFKEQNIFRNIGILLPDNTVILSEYGSGGQEAMSFEEKAGLGAHTEGGKEAGDVLRTFYPVKKNGRVAAILYGDVELYEVVEFPENGGLNRENTDIYIYDSASGSCIMNAGRSISFSGDGHDEVSEIVLDYLYFHDSFKNGMGWDIVVAARSKMFFAGVERKWQRIGAWMILEGVFLLAYLLWVLRNMRKARQQARQRRLKFLSSFSHNIRTPLNAILGFSAIASKNIDNKEQVLDCLEKIIDSGGQMMELINYNFAQAKEYPEKEERGKKGGTPKEDKSREREETETKMSLCGKRFLLVEDNELNREIILDFLTDQGIIAESAENGKEAVDLVSKSRPGYYDLIMMDIQMPVMDGYEAARRIRGLGREDLARMPIVAVTADAEEDVEDKLEQCGIDSYILKPFEEEKFERAVRSLLC